MSNASLLINQGTNSSINFDSAGGTFTQVVAPAYGTISTLGTLPNLPGGTLNSVTITGGTVSVNELSGTINVGTAVLNDGTIDVVKNAGTIQGGSIAITAGTIATLGTMGTLGLVNTVTTVSNITTGSIIQTAGTVNTGTINTGTINLGTVVGKDANAAAQTGNPQAIGGTDSGGTIRTIKVDSGGLQRMGLDSGTITVLPNIPGGTLTNLVSGTINAATAVINSATISVLPNLPQGSINVTAGTIATLGTMGTLGLVNTVTTVSNLTNGSIKVTAGTEIITSGSINVIAGTINTGTINTGTINLGTVVGKDANAAAQTGNPIAIGGTDSGGTIRTVLVNSAGALSVTGASAGTFVNLTTGTLNSGTIDKAVIFGWDGATNRAVLTDSSGILQINGTVSTGGAGTQATRLIDGTLTLGTMVGKDATGNAITANPFAIAGTNSGGTIRIPLVDDTGALKTTATLSSGTTVTVDHGSIVLTTGTINTGTINLGTVVGKDANAAAQTGNPLSIGGTDSGGTIRTIKVDSGGLQRIGIDSGTISVLPNLPGGSVVVTTGTIVAGTLTNLVSGTINAATAVINSATISVLPNLPQGSINVTAGTIATLGTMGTLGLVNTVTTVSNLTNGSIVQTVGTVNTGTINLGTFVGKDANAAAQTGNPLAIGGTDSGGTIRTIKVDSGGLQRIGLDSGTVSVLPNIPGGSIVVTTGTIVAGTLTNLISGTINSATAVVNSATISVLPNLPQGSINVTAGTINAGTVNTGTINTGTINLGTIVGKDANAAAQTGNPIAIGGTDSGGTVRTITVDSSGRLTVNSLASGTTVGTINAGTINVGTFRDDGRAGRNIVTFGTQVANSGAAAATIVGSASVGAGTSLWVQDFSILNPNGSVLVTLGFGTAQQGTNVLYRGVLGTQTAVGLEKSYAKAVNAGMTNQDLVLSTGAAGTVDLSISYFIST